MESDISFRTDFAAELGHLGFTMRIKRLSDNLMHEGKRMYKELDLDIEPNWFIIFRLLKSGEQFSVMEISDRIRLAHPSVISLTNKMIKAGYLSSEQCTLDNRKRLLSLTEKAMHQFPVWEQVWAAGSMGIARMLKGTGAEEALQIMETRFAEKGFKERTLDELKNSSINDPSEFEIIPFEVRFAPDFARLNYEWLEKYFEVESHDMEMLHAAESYIIQAGGQIFFARYRDETVGTCALIEENHSTYELAKMAVTPSYQGLKIGYRLIRHAIDYSRKVGKKRVVLESNTQLAAALNLYFGCGFRVIPLNPDSPYSRCNIRMELLL